MDVLNVFKSMLFGICNAFTASTAQFSDCPFGSMLRSDREYPFGEATFGGVDHCCSESSFADSDFTSAINPSSGLPMIDGMGGIDIGGHLWGDTSAPTSMDSSFGSWDRSSSGSFGDW